MHRAPPLPSRRRRASTARASTAGTNIAAASTAAAGVADVDASARPSAMPQRRQSPSSMTPARVGRRSPRRNRSAPTRAATPRTCPLFCCARCGSRPDAPSAPRLSSRLRRLPSSPASAGGGQRCARPDRQLLRIVVEAIRHAPIGHHAPPALLGRVGERLERLALECGRVVRIGLQVNDTARDEREHHTVGVEAGPAEQAAQLDWPEGGEQFADVVGRQGRSLARGTYCVSLAGLSLTDSPQPQAEVWLGLLNTNCADSLSVL